MKNTGIRINKKVLFTKKTLLYLTVLAALTFSSCSNNSETSPIIGDGAEEPAYQHNLNAITPKAYSNVLGLSLDPGTYLSIIGKETDSAYWNAVQEGVKQAAADINKELGYTGNDKVKVAYNAPGGSEDIDEQVNILDEELSRYPDAIAIASIDSTACTVQFDLATESDIPIVSFDSGNSYQGIQCTVETNNNEAAATAASKLCDEMSDTGSILVLVHDSNSTTAKNRVDGFQSEIANNHSGVTIAETLYYDQFDELKKTIAAEQNAALNQDSTDTTADTKDAVSPGTATADDDKSTDTARATQASDTKAVDAAELTDTDVINYYLTKHPEVTGFLGTNIDTTQTLLAASKELKLADKISLIGFDAGKEQITALKDGEIAGLVVQNPFGIGYASVIAAARSALGQGNEAVVDTGYIWVTVDNIDDDSIASMLYE
ncbi:MAG: substrate-binding domain-containing protein [Hespellia sp.]|nr:substrate-binding domain-containing protein [Hespellia sp.]